MTYISREQTLPQAVKDAFNSIQDKDVRDNYAAALRLAGWTYSAIGDASGVSRERVRQVVQDSTPTAAGPVPTPPLKPQPKPPKQYAQPDPDKLAKALELLPSARKVSGSSLRNRVEGEQYTATIADIHLNDNVPLYRLAKFMPVTAGALRSRLVRYGYLTPKTGTSKTYNRIAPENRV